LSLILFSQFVSEDFYNAFTALFPKSTFISLKHIAKENVGSMESIDQFEEDQINPAFLVKFNYLMDNFLPARLLPLQV
jgi:hypothetical protein